MASLGSISNSTSSSIYGSHKGIGGLASGLDTDELVKNMTAGTRSKIAKQLQQKTLLGWQQSAYRSISSKLVQFSQKYTSYSSTTNLFSESFFGKNLISALGSNSDCVDVSGTGSNDDISIAAIKQLAKEASLLTKGNVSDKTLSTGEFDFDETAATAPTTSTLAGKNMTITYGNKNYTFNLKEDYFYQADGSPVTNPSDIADAINKSMKDVKLSDGTTLDTKLKMTANNGKMTLEYTAASEGNNVIIKSAGTGVLQALGFKKGDEVQNGKIEGGTMGNLTEQIAFKDRIADASMTFTYNGVSKAIKMPSSTELSTMTRTDFEKHIQKQLDDSFGKNRIKVSSNPPGNSKAKLEFTTMKPDGVTKDESSTLVLSAGDGSAVGKHGGFQVNYGESNRLNLNSKFSESGLSRTVGAPSGTGDNAGKYNIKINNKDFYFDQDATINEIIDTINADPDAKVKISYLSTSDKFSVKSTEGGASGSINIQGELGDALFGTQGTDYTVEAGQDAEIYVDYDGVGGEDPVLLTRGSNNFTIDGLNITLKKEFGYDATAPNGISPTADPITFEAKANTENIINVVKDMIKDYNEIIELSNKQVSEKRNRDYAPLTDEQKEDMTEKEIEKWETEAKKGMLFNDMDLRDFTDSIRFIFSGSSQQISALEQIGITTSTNRTDNGKVILDENKFKAALEDRPDDVAKLFAEDMQESATGVGVNTATGGVMAKIKNVFDKFAGTEGATKGIFIEKAGSEYSPLSVLQNSILKKMDDIDVIVKDLKRRLKTETDRYYRQFTKLETTISQLNSQSSWLTQQTGQ